MFLAGHEVEWYTGLFSDSPASMWTVLCIWPRLGLGSGGRWGRSWGLTFLSGRTPGRSEPGAAAGQRPASPLAGCGPGCRVSSAPALAPTPLLTVGDVGTQPPAGSCSCDPQGSAPAQGPVCSSVKTGPGRQAEGRRGLCLLVLSPW
uniref:Uncharacterized protein n=1 Tax=Rousettus aegyptiacus TaxID=9407 RepID=A0A7J8C2E2_ROUAE|nr:hypothetical protein HJG63_009318 [Rousettus aegyptiacus]